MNVAQFWKRLVRGSLLAGAILIAPIAAVADDEFSIESVQGEVESVDIRHESVRRRRCLVRRCARCGRRDRRQLRRLHDADARIERRSILVQPLSSIPSERSGHRGQGTARGRRSAAVLIPTPFGHHGQRNGCPSASSAIAVAIGVRRFSRPRLRIDDDLARIMRVALRGQYNRLPFCQFVIPLGLNLQVAAIAKRTPVDPPAACETREPTQHLFVCITPIPSPFRSANISMPSMPRIARAAGLSRPLGTASTAVATSSRNAARSATHPAADCSADRPNGCCSHESLKRGYREAGHHADDRPARRAFPDVIPNDCRMARIAP